MLRKIKQHLNRKRLKDERYAALFDPAPEGCYVCFDVETTGLDVKRDDIISIAAVKIVENRIVASERFERFVRLDREIGEESIRVHQIRGCDLEDGCSMDEVLKDFLEFVQNWTLVGYYLEFDVAMVNKYLRPKLGIVLPNVQVEVSALYYDYKIGRIPQGNVDLRFDTIMKELDLPLMAKHNALNDALMTAMMFLKLKGAG
jgi:DNA polymerase-3 subunit epsilon